MIAQARITSETTATVHLAARDVEIQGDSITDVRTQVKQAFIAAAREAGEPIDVVIVESDVRHHLLVEPTGRITARTADDRPLYGPREDAQGPEAAETPAGTAPAAGAPAAASASDEGSALTATSLPTFTAAGDPSEESSDQPVEPAGFVPVAPPADASEGTASASPVTAPSPVTASPMPASSVATSPVAPSPAQAPASDSAPVATLAAAPTTAAPAPANTPAAPSSAEAPASASAPSASASASTASGLAPAGKPAAAAPASPSAAADPSAPARPTVQATDRPRPTLQDLQEGTRPPTEAPATRGWQGTVARMTGGRISPAPNRAEREEREQLARITRSLDAPKNIAVVNLKGGAHKTTSSLMLAATLGRARGGGVLAWDNNETRGTLGWRGMPGQHKRTALDLLHNLDSLQDPSTTVSDLDRYVRPQEATRFDILASDEDPGSAALIDEDAFHRLNDTLSRFYRLKVIDTGNNVRASNWLAAVRSADQLVIVSTLREDTFNAAAWMIDELRATGLAEQVDHAVTILSHNSTKKVDPVLRTRLLQHFGAHTRAIVEVPFEHQFVDGSPLDWPRIHPSTKAAWLKATAAVVDGL
ncbi:chromosome partitioning protein [Brachybacterium sp. JHP9]|uniref:Chromosome partitioning protein n=1 Tax=Brachybacterium equifaecis TaxID=2910770 RepID=A0ABT0QZV9_9MICO|nr:chromosome partitioning protein [Brachybacterium equifaecis]MCL6423192.1 chromosome partitioning protein [Brachybacterium equifaecis]